MIDIQNSSKKLNSSLGETSGILEKYEMGKLNKYGVVITIAIINIALWSLIYRIYRSQDMYYDYDLIIFTLMMFGVVVALFSLVFLYFNKKTNYLLDQRTQKSEQLIKTMNTLEIKKTKTANLVIDRSMMKSFLSLAIEKTLLEIGKPTYDEVVIRLAKDHRCSLLDCYDDPEYLKRVLSDLFGKSYDSVLESIKENLREFKSDELPRKFLTVMTR